MSSKNGVEATILPCQRALFDIPDDIAYLNCAFMGPLMHRVVAAGEAGVRRKQHPWDITPPDFFELPDRGRDLFGRIIGSGPENISVVPSVSYGIGIAAQNLEVGPGQANLFRKIRKVFDPRSVNAPGRQVYTEQEWKNAPAELKQVVNKMREMVGLKSVS